MTPFSPNKTENKAVLKKQSPAGFNQDLQIASTAYLISQNVSVLFGLWRGSPVEANLCGGDGLCPDTLRLTGGERHSDLNLTEQRSVYSHSDFKLAKQQSV